MRAIEDIQKEQEQACYEWGFNLAKAEQAKAKVFMLAEEAAKVKAIQEEVEKVKAQEAQEAKEPKEPEVVNP